MLLLLDNEVLRQSSIALLAESSAHPAQGYEIVIWRELDDNIEELWIERHVKIPPLPGVGTGHRN